VENLLKSYLKRIFDISNRGDAREESYYSALEELLNQYAESIGKKSIQITTLPKKTEAGNPDFRVWDGKQHIVGYIEAKAPTTEYLDQIETTDQLKRYINIFPNLILTNFYEFRLYRKGVQIDKVIIARSNTAHKLRTVPVVEKETEFFALLNKYFSFLLPKVTDAKNLATELAKRTRFLRDEVIAEELKEEKSSIFGFYDAFRKYLISGLTKEEFADLYSQTITYGLFAARTRSENEFNRKLAYDYIPRTIGILRDVFKFISLEDLPQQMEWIIDDISEVLAVTDVKNILHQYFHEGKGKDPIVHFYETFLAEYDPKTREKRGVYYTPEPVVSYIVRSLHNILKEHFDRRDGFAESSVTVLDPAAGTLTFLTEAAKLTVKEAKKYGEGIIAPIIKEHILQNFYAFELMMAPYAIGHLKMAFLLEELGYKLEDDDRFKLYLTNTLEMKKLAQTELPGMSSLSEESHLAEKVKKQTPILVILGNPPYSGMSANKNPWIDNLLKEDVNGLQSYYKVDGNPLGEKNPKWLQDDYVKFIRFAQWKINQDGEGILGFITNHSYLDNPTFRGMRQSLMNSFDEIYFLDLHGNALKKEKCPDGSKDENVFDIMQGVAIALFIKRKDKNDEPLFRPSPQGKIQFEKIPKERPKKHICKIYHSEIWGLRDKKYEWLEKKDIKTTKWKKLSPKSEMYLFIPRNEELLKDYERYQKVTDIFPINSVGIVTARDNFVIDFDKETLKRRIDMFTEKKIPDEIISQTFGLSDKSNWALKDAREKVREDKNWKDSIKEILYRPFDKRWIFYHGSVIERSRHEVMRHMKQENLGLIVNRQIRIDKIRHTFITSNIVDLHILETANASAYLFPLYLYPEKEKPKKHSGSTMMIFEPKAEYGAKRPNINQALIEQLTKEFKKTFTFNSSFLRKQESRDEEKTGFRIKCGMTTETITPEQIFYYIYAVLYSNTYRTKYAEFLKIDFPRIPFTADYKLFIKMGEYGQRLADLHLLKSKEIDSPTTQLNGNGKNDVDKIKYERGRVYINKEQYFDSIKTDIWEYQIGGYQVCDKWLKDRKGMKLSAEDIRHYSRIITALQKTIEVQKKIDKIYLEVEKQLIEFKS